MNFVSEKELKAQQESGIIDEPIDHRPLYERLKEVKDKAEAEKQEMFSLKNQFRGLDEDESDFLDKVDKMKRNSEKKKKEEEHELLKQQIRADALATSFASTSSGLSLSSLKPKIEKVPAKDEKKNKESLKKLIVKRKADPSSSETSQLKIKKVEEAKSGKKEPEVKVDRKEPEVKANKPGGLLTGYVISSDEES